MKHWDLNTIGSSSTEGNDPQILSSANDGRAILLHLASGQTLDEHQVHEQAWIVTVSGEVEVAPAGGEPVAAGPGQMFEFDPGERHELTAKTEARVLLLLIPWPGDGHPGAMTLEEKAQVRERAAAQAER
jgi:quercetin dioxygenase-like cupin family protein